MHADMLHYPTVDVDLQLGSLGFGKKVPSGSGPKPPGRCAAGRRRLLEEEDYLPRGLAVWTQTKQKQMK